MIGTKTPLRGHFADLARNGDRRRLARVRQRLHEIMVHSNGVRQHVWRLARVTVTVTICARGPEHYNQNMPCGVKSVGRSLFASNSRGGTSSAAAQNRCDRVDPRSDDTQLPRQGSTVGATTSKWEPAYVEWEQQTDAK